MWVFPKLHAIEDIQVEINLQEFFTDHSDQIVDFLSQGFDNQEAFNCFFKALNLPRKTEQSLREHLKALQED